MVAEATFSNEEELDMTAKMRLIVWTLWEEVSKSAHVCGSRCNRGNAHAGILQEGSSFHHVT